MRKELILQLQNEIRSNHGQFTTPFYILSNSKEQVRHTDFFGAILGGDDAAIYEYLKKYTVKKITLGLRHSSIEQSLQSAIVSKLSEIIETTSFEALADIIISEEPVVITEPLHSKSTLTIEAPELTIGNSQASDLTKDEGDGMPGFIKTSTLNPKTGETSAIVAAEVKEEAVIYSVSTSGASTDGAAGSDLDGSAVVSGSTSNTVDSGAAVVVEQPKALVSSNSFFKVMTSDTAKLVAASISLFAGAALTVFLGVTGMASIALAALAAALVIISVACIVILMKNKTSEPDRTM